MRIFIASVAGLTFLVLWISGAAVLGDVFRGTPILVQFVYYAIAGFVWVFPIRWLMLWAARMR